MYRYYFFDLDGTLTDPGIGITNSVMYSLKKYNIEVAERSELFRFIGPPLRDSYMNFYGFSEERAEEAVAFYREYFRDKGIFENEVYDGIPELLSELKKCGATIVLATSKPQEFAVRILDHFHLSEYFDYVSGASMDNSRNNKRDIIEAAIEALQISDRSEILMVGDREHDVLGAKACGIDAAGVLYGYGSREELVAAGARYLAESPRDLPVPDRSLR